MRQRIALDVECYRNYFLVMFKGAVNGVTRAFEMYPGHELDARRVMHILHNNETFGFNSLTYDIPMITLACAGADNVELKLASDYLILNDEATPWNFERRYRVKLPSINHFDLKEPAPGVMISLKLYGGRMHSQTLQDLPIEPDATISEDDRLVLREYCGNDLSTTIELHDKLLPQIELRERMGEQYDMDLRSKSDAQIAEAVIRSEVEGVLGVRLRRPDQVTSRFKYHPPTWLEFRGDILKGVLDTVSSANFVVKPNGVVELPDEIAALKIKMGSSVYRMGIGGLHSSEKGVSHVVDDSYVLIDRDVSSYYPSIILNERLYPANMGEDFLNVYQEIVSRRLAAKRDGDKITADTLKITINGSFGKFGSKWSVLYSPTLLIQVTLTGQLALLMLIESLEHAGIPVVSANTDGVVIKCPVESQEALGAIISEWERVTGFATEDTQYRALYSRDVNNYLAVKLDGEVKLKGIFAPPGLMKNPSNTVVTDAIVAHLTNNLPVAETIRSCDDIRKFLTVRTVKGGAEQDGRYLGKVVRWYYSAESPGPITYRSNGNKVAKSDGSRAMMHLVGMPTDIDYSWYEREANDILSHLGI